MKYIFFRVDSSYDYASGHLVRCSRLAKFFSKKYKVIFLTNKFKGNFNFIIKKYKKIYLKYNNSNSINSKKDSAKVVNILKKFNGEKIILVDHYKLDFKWQKHVNKYVNKLICINDYIKKNYCDFLINESYFPKNKTQKCLKKNTVILPGPKYAMIDPIGTRRSKGDGIFLFFGSVDRKNITFKIVKILKNITKKKIYVIIGSKNKNKHRILLLGKKNKNIIMINKHVNLDMFFRKSDMAIISGGSVLWEALYHKLKLIVIPTEKNQNSNLKNLRKNNIIKTIHFNKLNENAIKNLIKIRKINPIRSLVDRNGIKRIYKKIV